jgi:hypothetical protein
MQRFSCISGGRLSRSEACPSLAVELKTAAQIARRHMGADFPAIVSFPGKSMIP